MRYALFGLWGLIGFDCGNVPRRWPFPWPPVQESPQPQPWSWGVTIASVIGGIAGGWAYYQTWYGGGREEITGLDAAATSLGSVVGALALRTIGDMLMNRPRA